MVRPTLRSITAGLLGGVANGALAVALIETAGYAVVESTAETTVLTAIAFGFGFVPVVLSAHTRLVAPAAGVAALLVGVTYTALTSPPAAKLYELGGHDVVSEPALFSRYARFWPVWFGLLIVAGVAEYAIRRGYGLWSHPLRNLPDLPLPRSDMTGAVVVASSLVGVGAAIEFKQLAPLAAFLLAAAATAVPLTAVLSRGFVTPLLLFAIWVPRSFHVEAFGDPHGVLHLFVLLPFTIGCAIAWALEALVRSRVRGWDGGRFTDGIDTT